MRRPLTAALILALLVAPSAARANGEGGPAGPPTTFERFVLSACSPCVRESYAITSLKTAPLALPGFPRVASGAGSRVGEIAIDVLRARQVGRSDWQSLALQVTLWVTPSPGSEMFRLGFGLLDAADVRALAQAVAEMPKLATAAPANSGPESLDIDFHGGSLRIGVLRIRGEVVAYVQAGDLQMLMQRAVWEVPTTLYLPVASLPALAAALTQAAATIEKVRGN